MGSVSFFFDPLPPFRLDLTFWALRRRPGHAVDRWDGTTYRHVLTINLEPVDVRVRQTGPVDVPCHSMAAAGAGVAHGMEPVLVAVLRRLLGLDVDLSRVYAFATADDRLAPLALRFRGLKPPRYPTLFEALANAIACQPVTLTLGISMLNHLV